MSAEKRLGRYLGTAFLLVFAGSVLSETLSASILSGSAAETLENIAENQAQMRASTLVELCITSVGIVVLAALLYTAVRKQNPVLALVALGWWLAEAITLAVSTIGAFLLIPVSEAYAEADASASFDLLALADALQDLDRQMWEIHMVFYAVGAVVFYALLYQSRSVPHWLSAFGVGAVILSLFSSVLFLATDVDWFFLGFPTGLFELVIGVWLLVNGISQTEAGLVDGERRVA